MMSILKFVVVLFILRVSSYTRASVFPDGSILWTDNSNSIYSTNQTQGWISDPGLSFNLSSVRLNGLITGYGLAVDTHAQQVVVSDPGDTFLAIFKPDNTTASFFYVGTSKGVGQVTIDWRARNVYWADGGYGWIAMKPLPEDISRHNSLDTTMKVVVDQQLDTPTGIVVHPHAYYLFWADAGKRPKIERSDLTGNNRSVIIWQSLITPRALAIHQHGNGDKLFWTDEDRGTIEFCNLDGTGRNILISIDLFRFFGLDIFQGVVFYTAYTQSSNYTGYIKINNTDTQSYRTLDKRMYHLSVYDKASQPREETGERCDSSFTNCSQICIHEDDVGNHACLCLDGYQLDNTRGKLCSDRGYNVERHLLFTNYHSICAIAINAFTIHDKFKSFPYNCSVVQNSHGNITRFSLDMAGRKIFFSNGTHIFEQTPFHNDFRIVYSTEGSTAVTDMDFDWILHRLYWIESSSGALLSIQPYESSSTVSLKTLSSDGIITNLAVDPHQRNIYFVTRGNNGQYLYVYDLANEAVSQVEASHLQMPTDLEYDRLQERLVWNDDGGFIGFLALGDKQQIPTQNSAGDKRRHAVIPYKKFVFSSTEEDRQFDVLYEGDNSLIYVSFTGIYDTFVHDMHVYDETLQPSETGPCDVNNGGCEHFCLPHSTEKCACKLGYTLSNGKECITSALKSDFFIVLDQVHGRLYQATNDATGPSDVFALEINENNSPAALAFDSNTNTMAWVDNSVPKTVRTMTIGGTEERNLDVLVKSDGYLAIDSSTGNVYVLTGNIISVVNKHGKTHILIDKSADRSIEMKTIALLSSQGKMAWIEEKRTDRQKRTVNRANMDGTKIREVIQSGIITDIAFDTETGDWLYWSEETVDKVRRVHLEDGTQETVYEAGGLNPIALDVAGEFVYFVPRAGRKIYRIPHASSSGHQLVFENPLLGSLNNFFVSHSAGTVQPHSSCADCNGGCSDICLPDSPNGRTCACDDSDEQTDDTNCKRTSRCPVMKEESISALTDCCPQQPDALCLVTCANGFIPASPFKLKCQPTGWNASLGAVCSEVPNPLPFIAIAAGGGGAVSVIVFIIVVVCICRRKGKRLKEDNDDSRYTTTTSLGTVSNGQLVMDSDRHGYSTAADTAGPTSTAEPPRRLTEDEQADGGVYHDLDEAAMAAKTVELPDKSTVEKHRRKNSYQAFPQSADATYLHASLENGVPRPDYPYPSKGYPYNGPKGPASDADDYLLPSSGSRASAGISDRQMSIGWQEAIENPIRMSKNGAVYFDPSNGQHTHVSLNGEAPVAHARGFHTGTGSGWTGWSDRSDSRSGSSDASAYNTRIISRP
ncbi:low-density lipoprotein receptor-related protein 4-like [Mya arenaria]|uniref:low-density lipoprotein receptor-related protein 4-like n=1 Tax=Mya arenaria TaxID=6604 RepID=UPI0022E3808C|nr:low-density lipoprotein receptor-related protein 4-like [Mya arenaria]